MGRQPNMVHTVQYINDHMTSTSSMATGQERKREQVLELICGQQVANPIHLKWKRGLVVASVAADPQEESYTVLSTWPEDLHLTKHPTSRHQDANQGKTPGGKNSLLISLQSAHLRQDWDRDHRSWPNAPNLYHPLPPTHPEACQRNSQKTPQDEKFSPLWGRTLAMEETLWP